MLGFMLGKLEERDRDDRRGGGGGGGRARIRFGRTGPRGRMYSTSGAARMRSSVVKSSFVFKSADAARHITAHLRYIQEREKGELEKGKERDFFDREREGIERAEVDQAMKRGQGEKVSMHKIILSPGDNAVDLREYTRESMHALEDRLGHKLDWYGVEHRNTENHHVHVVIAGKIPERERELFDREPGEAQEREAEAERAWWLKREQDSERTKEEARLERMLDRVDRERAAKEGAAERGDVYLDRADLKELRDAGNEYRLRERSFDRALEKAWEREFDREPEREREKERERPQYREPVYDREKADEMIEKLLEKTTDRSHEERQIESTDRYQDLLDKIAAEDLEQFKEYFKEREERGLPSGRDEDLDRLLGWETSVTKDIDDRQEREPELEDLFPPEKDKEREKQKEAEEYEQRTGFAGAADQDRGDDDAWQSFEADRQVMEQQESQEPERERDDLDRGDDFGR